MADVPRRVRTQAERDADGTAWRATAATRPGYATYPQTAPGSPSWWRRGKPLATGGIIPGPPPGDDRIPFTPGGCLGPRLHPGGPVAGPPVEVRLDDDECVLVMREGVGVMCVRDHERHDATPGKALPPAPECMYPPDATQLPVARRRWWHRYTRRAL